MGFSFQNIILLLNLINAVYSTQSSLKPTNSSGKPRMNDGKFFYIYFKFQVLDP
jgi:hypothetical protein